MIFSLTLRLQSNYFISYMSYNFPYLIHEINFFFTEEPNTIPATRHVSHFSTMHVIVWEKPVGGVFVVGAVPK